jgi:hypothetical protein
MRLPNDTQRSVIIGVTGSGKTHAAIWQLSLRSIDQVPWVIYNYKGDELIDNIPHAKHIGLDDLPIKPGVYVVHPTPVDEPDVQAHLWAIWGRGSTGIVFDEGYMMGRNNHPFRAIQTQGRSKHIPAITLTQRPAWVDPFVFTEADFIQVFRLNHKRDKDRVAEFSPIDMEKQLPPFHSHYWDVGANSGSGSHVIMRPVPEMTTIYATFHRRLGRKPEEV